MSDGGELSSSTAKGKEREMACENPGAGVHLDTGVIKNTGGRGAQNVLGLI